MSQTKEDLIELTRIGTTHNQACFNYLKKLKLSPRLFDDFPDELAQLARIEAYNPEIAYGNMYTNLIECINSKRVMDKLTSELALNKARIEVQEDISNNLSAKQKPLLHFFHNHYESRIRQLELDKSNLEEQVENLL
jgi:hypothetical protein